MHVKQVEKFLYKMGDTIHTGENVIMDLERNEVQITGASIIIIS